MKESFRSRPSSISGPVVLPAELAGITFNTPGGRPARSMTSASASIDSGVSRAGLITIVQPAATAGPTLRVPIASGKFHGVMSRQGPTGPFIVSSRPAPFGATA